MAARRLTTHPAFVAPVVILVVLAFVYLFWKGGSNAASSVDPAVARRVEASAAARADAAQRQQQQAANAALAQVTRPKGRALRVAFIGDAISTGAFASTPQNAYAARVAAWLRGKMPVEVSNRSADALTASQALATSVPTRQDVVIVFLGSSDYHSPNPQNFATSFPRLIGRVHQLSPRSQIVCLTPWIASSGGNSLRDTIHKTCSDPKFETLVDVSKVVKDVKSRVKKGDPYRGGTVPFDGFPNDRGHLAIAAAIEKMIQIVP